MSTARILSTSRSGSPIATVFCWYGAWFFECYTPHRPHPNRTARSRRVPYFNYNKASQGDSREQYCADKPKNCPPNIERDPGKDYRFKV